MSHTSRLVAAEIQNANQLLNGVIEAPPVSPARFTLDTRGHSADSRDGRARNWHRPHCCS